MEPARPFSVHRAQFIDGGTCSHSLSLELRCKKVQHTCVFACPVAAFHGTVWGCPHDVSSSWHRVRGDFDPHHPTQQHHYRQHTRGSRTMKTCIYSCMLGACGLYLDTICFRALQLGSSVIGRERAATVEKARNSQQDRSKCLNLCDHLD